MATKRVLSGMRPTGRLHLGNLHGALNNWIELQGRDDCERFYFVADWHALTSDYAETGHLREWSRQMVIDWLGAGLDPDKSTIFVQSAIKEHAELFVLLSMITPIAWLERNPSYKEMKEEITNKDLSTFGFLGYPVLQSADIIIYKANYVPVGVDQLPHIELTREIARRFNHLYGDTFPIPEHILTAFPKLLGIDGRKMSKSYGNSIYIGDSGEALRQKIEEMFTDPQRVRRNDPGRPELCNVYAFHKLYSTEAFVLELKNSCENALIGCRECKKRLSDAVCIALAPIHERIDHYNNNSSVVEEIIAVGNAQAKAIAQETMEQVRAAVRI